MALPQKKEGAAVKLNPKLQPKSDTIPDSDVVATRTIRTRAGATGPALQWTADKDRALVEAVATAHNLTDVLDYVTVHPAFADDVEAGAVTKEKLQLRIQRFRRGVKAKDGTVSGQLDIPSLGRSRYRPNVEELAAILEAQRATRARA